MALGDLHRGDRRAGACGGGAQEVAALLDAMDQVSLGPAGGTDANAEEA